MTCPETTHLGTLPVVLVDPATDLKTALEVDLRHPGGAFLVEDDGDGETGDGCAGLVGECQVHIDPLKVVSGERVERWEMC